MSIRPCTPSKSIIRLGSLAGRFLAELSAAASPGISTLALDERFVSLASTHGVRSGMRGYQGFPAHISTSVNDVACFGIPSADAMLQQDDVLTIDLVLECDGEYVDTAATVLVTNEPSVENEPLVIRVARESLHSAIAAAQPGASITEVVQAARRPLAGHPHELATMSCGHGIGVKLHQSPRIHALPEKCDTWTLKVGDMLALEPIVNVSTPICRLSGDGWSWRTANGCVSAFFEHTILVTTDGPIILTALER